MTAEAVSCVPPSPQGLIFTVPHNFNQSSLNTDGKTGSGRHREEGKEDKSPNQENRVEESLGEETC